MATKTFYVQEVLEAAFRRCRIPLSSLSGEDSDAAKAELSLLLSDWYSEHLFDTTTSKSTVTLASATTYVTASTAAQDVIFCARSTNTAGSNVSEMQGYNLAQYRGLSNPTVTGLPSIFFFEKSTNRIYIYPTPAVATNLYYTYTRRVDDLLNGTDSFALPFPLWDAFVWELAWRIGMLHSSVKPELVEGLKKIAMEKRESAASSAILPFTLHLGPSVIR
jgi:hypothetical protein